MKLAGLQAVGLALVSLSLAACSTSQDQRPRAAPKVTVTTVATAPVTLTEKFVCQIRAHHHIQIRAPETGNLAAVEIRTGQPVKQNDLLFRVEPTTNKSDLDAASPPKPLFVNAPFDGLIGRVLHHQGDLVQRGETLTTLSDIDTMWVYFNVPDARYLEFMAADGTGRPPGLNRDDLKRGDPKLDGLKLEDLKIELQLSSGAKYDQPGTLGAIGSHFDAETGNIPFRADFPNPAHLLRHGQTGNVLVRLPQADAIVIPQRATLEVGQKRYVFVVDQDKVAHWREVTIAHEVDDDFVVTSGVDVGDKIVVDGLRRLSDGDKVESTERSPSKVVAHAKPTGE